MRINSVSNVSFGQNRVAKDVKEDLTLHTAYGIGDGKFSDFKEKYRLTNLSKRFDINVTKEGSTVKDKETGKETSFKVSEFGDYSNVHYYLLNAAMNYSLLKEADIFKE